MTFNRQLRCGLAAYATLWLALPNHAAAQGVAPGQADPTAATPGVEGATVSPPTDTQTSETPAPAMPLTPATEPSVEPVPSQPPTPTVAEATAPTAAAAAGITGITGIFGVGLGIGSGSGASGDVYGIAWGEELTIGVRSQQFSVELHTLVGFAKLPRLTQLHSAETRGEFQARSLLGRYRVVETNRVGLSLFAGIAVASVPMLSVDSPMVRSANVDGFGLTLGTGLAVPLTTRLEFAVDGALYLMAWELPGGTYAVNVRPIDANQVMYTASSDSISALPWRLTGSLRVHF